MATLQGVTTNGNNTNKGINFRNPLSKENSLQIAAWADPSLYHCQMDNASMQFRHLPSGAFVNVSNAQIEIFDANNQYHVWIAGDITFFESPSGKIIIRDGMIIGADFDLSHMLDRDYPNDEAAKAAGVKHGHLYHSNGVPKIQRLK